MCYWEKNIRKQIEIAFLLTAFFRILLNKLPLCSASSYSWTSSRKSNLELIKKKCNACDEVAFSCSWSRLLCWSTSASIWIIQRHFVFQDWEIYIRSCNLIPSPGAIFQSMKETFPTLDDLTNFRHFFFCTKTWKFKAHMCKEFCTRGPCLSSAI